MNPVPLCLVEPVRLRLRLTPIRLGLRLGGLDCIIACCETSCMQMCVVHEQ